MRHLKELFPERKWSSLAMAGVCSLCLLILAGGYTLYRHSIEDAVGGTTRSYMEQLAEHDIRNVGNQIDSRLNYLHSLSARMRLLRQEEQFDIPYLLSVDAQSTQFQKLYLITTQGTVYDSAYLVSTLDEFPWAKTYQAEDGDFVTRYVIDKREEWGEYLLYGTRLDTPVPYAGEQIEGIVGLVPLEELSGLIHLESFDGQGMTLVIEPDGTIITASRYYDSDANLNYFAELEQASFLNHSSLEKCKTAISLGESLYVEYIFQNIQYNAMLRPVGKESCGNGWYMIVKVPDSVSAGQTRSLLNRSLFFFALLSVVVFALAAFVFKNMRAVQIAKASERAKSTFLANMSHEIRTPLNGITGLLYLMHQNLDSREKLEEYLEKAEVSADFLKSVITEVLDMSKIESGQMELYCKKLNLEKLLREIDMLIAPQAEERKQHFSIDCGTLASPWVLGDEVRLKQIIVNLLGNSLKFTPPEGSITLSVRQSLQGETAATTFRIIDTGCGMSPEFLEKIWLPFEQEHRPGSINGTGLGTTLSKLLAEKMGGTIEVASREGEGTTFTVQLPLTAAQPEELSASSRNDRQVTLEGMRILAAEDNDINREILTEILTGYGAVVTPAVNGREAVDIFSKSPVSAFYVILMDIQMPVLDGYEAAKRIRAMNRPDSGTVPILALTANAFKNEAEQAKESGMNDVVTKPLDVNLLLQKLSALETEPPGTNPETDTKKGKSQEETV